jgi:hypothetical protein
LIIIKIKTGLLVTILTLLVSSLLLNATVYSPPYIIKEYNVKLLQPSSIVIDGVISPNEWDGAENITKWFMDADPENYDGFNYIYLAEDGNYLYLGLDLVSDQTNDEVGEWVGLWLNTNNTFLDDLNQNIGFKNWYDKLDRGFESLIIDVENNQTMPFFTSGYGTEYFEIRSLSDLNVISGSFNGILDDIIWWDSLDATITSEYNGSFHVSRLDINFDLKDYFDIFPELFIDTVQSGKINCRISNNISLTEHYLSIRDSSGNLLISSSDHTKSIPSGTVEFSVDITALPGNFTQDDVVQFSLIGIDDVPFETYIDFISFEPVRSDVSFLAGGWLEYPYSSIQQYDVKWSFGASDNNATAHRMFEFKIPKNELDQYSQNTNLGLMVGGYGTLVGFPNTHNWILANNTDSGTPIYYTPYYYYYDMPMKGWTQPNNPVLSPVNPNPSTTGDITLNWNADSNVVNWTVLRYDSEISELNIDDVEIIGAGLTTNQFNDIVTTNGLYWYAVVGIDTLGYAYLSNIESISVEIPTTTSTTTTETTTTSSSASSTTSGGSDEGFLPGFTLSGSIITIFVSLLYYRKRK